LDCTTALQIGCGSKKAKRLHNAQKAAYLKKSLPFKAKLVRLPPAAHVSVLTSLAAWQLGCIQSAAGTDFCSDRNDSASSPPVSLSLLASSESDIIVT
jgi:hypothetical protein